MTTRGPGWMVALLLVPAVAGAGRPAFGQASTPGASPTAGVTSGDPGPGEVAIVHLQGNVHLIVSEAANTVIQVGEDGVLVIDSNAAGLGDQVLAAIRTVSNRPIHYIINTHVHADHVGGNEALVAAGPTRLERNPVTSGLGGNVGARTSILAHENVLARMSASVAGIIPRAPASWPTETYFTPTTDLYFNGEAVQMLHQPAAHTDGDSLVFFRRSDVIAAGDVFLTTTYPIIDLERGGSVDGIVAALNRIIALAVPTQNAEGGTLVIPGHGRISDEIDVVEYRNMVTIVRDRVKDLIRRGMSLEQVQAARPSRDYDPRYAGDGASATSTFIASVYRSLGGAEER